MADIEPAQNKTKSDNSPNPIDTFFLNLSESTFKDSAYIPESTLKPYNPDDLWQKAGSFEIYEDMLKDEQVQVALQLKKDLVLGSCWEIESDDEEDPSGEEKEFIEMAFKDDCEDNFDDCLEELISSYEYGFSITEKIFKKRTDGLITLKNLKTRHPDTWLIHTDPHGIITKYEQRADVKTLEVNPQSLIHITNGEKFQNPYGSSDLRTAHSAWFFKTHALRYYGIFMEKNASPFPVGKYSPNTPATEVDNFFDTIKKIQNRTAMVIPDAFELEMVQTTNRGEAYEKAINMANMFIGRALFIPDLLGLSGAETRGGSFSLGKQQIGIFFKHINRRRLSLETTINRELIQPLIVNNFGIRKNYPKIKFKPIDDDSAVELAKIWLEAIKGKAYKPTEDEINYFRSLVKFPKGEVDFYEPAPNPLLNPIQKPEGAPAVAQSEADDKALAIPAKKDMAYKIPENYGDYYKKVDFSSIKAQMDSVETSIHDELAPITKKIFADLYDQIEKKGILKNQKVERLDSIKLKYLREMKQVFKENLRDVHSKGYASAQKELLKGNYALPLPDDKFLEVLDQEIYNFIGKWEYTVTDKAKTEIISAIKDGKPLNTLIKLLDDDGKELSDVQLERYARTKTTEVFNRGRHEFFEDSGVVAGYQFSAIMDDVTTEICSGLNGKKFAAGDEPIPPLHWNCRSLLIPITKYEEFDPDEKVGRTDINKFIEENKGQGFSVQ